MSTFQTIMARMTCWGILKTDQRPQCCPIREKEVGRRVVGSISAICVGSATMYENASKEGKSPNEGYLPPLSIACETVSRFEIAVNASCFCLSPDVV